MEERLWSDVKRSDETGRAPSKMAKPQREVEGSTPAASTVVSDSCAEKSAVVPAGCPSAKKTYADRPPGDPPRASNREAQVWHACANCGLWYAARARRLERGNGICCSYECWRVHAVAVGLMAGPNNPRWLGGVSNDNMRYRRRQLEREPIKEAARRAAKDAIRRGRLVRRPCEQCGAARAHAHHDDYSKPLDVRWLCRPCHTAHHVAERKRLRESA